MRLVICTVLFTLAFKSNILQAIGAGDDIKRANVNSPKYYAEVTQSTNTGECVQTAVIKGRGVDDSYVGPCLTGEVSFISTDEVLVIGDPTKDSYVLYSNKPSNLKVINDEECNRILYFIDRRTGRLSGDLLVMTNQDCDRARREVAAQLKNNKNLQRLTLKPGESDSASSEPTAGLSVPNPWESDVMGLSHWAARNAYFDVKTGTSQDEEGMCKQSLVVQGRGISDRFVAPCDDYNSAAVFKYKTAPIMVVKNPRLTLFTTEESLTLYVIRDDQKCEKKVYQQNRFSVGSRSEDVTGPNCNALVQRANSYISDAEANEEEWVISGL